jgi:hypothetical protein
MSSCPISADNLQRIDADSDKPLKTKRLSILSLGQRCGRRARGGDKWGKYLCFHRLAGMYPHRCIPPGVAPVSNAAIQVKCNGFNGLRRCILAGRDRLFSLGCGVSHSSKTVGLTTLGNGGFRARGTRGRWAGVSSGAAVAPWARGTRGRWAGVQFGRGGCAWARERGRWAGVSSGAAVAPGRGNAVGGPVSVRARRLRLGAGTRGRWAGVSAGTPAFTAWT